jgi:2-aminoadipate transaminase
VTIDYDPYFSRGARAMRASAIRRAGDVRGHDLISLAPGFPDPTLFAWDEFRDIAQTVLSGTDSTALQYGPTRGYRPLLEALCEILHARGMTATLDEVIVTTGSQQALDLCGRVFADAGAAILVELPTYTGAITAFGNTGAALAGVRQDADGIDLADLDRVYQREQESGRRVAFVYVVPNFQNPTGRLMSLQRRLGLLEWAVRRRVLIVEDDPYGALFFDDVASVEDTRPIKADDHEGVVVYLSSFSKTLAPGFRVAWLTAAAAIVSKVEIAKQSADLCTGGLDQRMVCEMWTRGTLTGRLPALRAAYQRKRTVMEEALRRELGGVVTWPEPKGGFFLWAALPAPIDAGVMLPRAIEQGVVYVPGEAFFVDGRGAEYARLAFSSANAEGIELGIARFGRVVRNELMALAARSPGASPDRPGSTADPEEAPSVR